MSTYAQVGGLRFRHFLQRFRQGRGGGLPGAGGGDHDHADEHQQRSDQGSRTDGLASKEIADDHGHYRVDISVRANLRRRFMMDEPDIGGKPHDGAGYDQVGERVPGAARDRLQY